MSTCVLVASAIVLLASPVTVSHPVGRVEALIIVGGRVVALAANFALMLRTFRALERIVDRMERVDLLEPEERLPVTAFGPAARVGRAFNGMLDRLGAERQQSTRRAFCTPRKPSASASPRPPRRGRAGSHRGAPPARRRRRSGDARTPARDRRDAHRGTPGARGGPADLAGAAPAMLEQLGLVSAVTELATTYARPSGVRVRRDLAPRLPALAPEVELAIYRIAQESLTNLARHADATNVTDSGAAYGASAGGIATLT